MGRQPGYIVSLPQFKKQKIKMLQRDFCMRLTDEEISHIQNGKTEAEVDSYVHNLFLTKLK